MLNKIAGIQKGLETIHTTTPEQTAVYLEDEKQQGITTTSSKVSSSSSSRSFGRRSQLGDPSTSNIKSGGGGGGGGGSISDYQQCNGLSPQMGYPGISRSPSPFSPSEDESVSSSKEPLNITRLCNLKIT